MSDGDRYLDMSYADGMEEESVNGLDFYTQFCQEVESEHIAADLPAAAVVGICTRIAHRVQRRLTAR
jgi:hypothetical protein